MPKPQLASWMTPVDRDILEQLQNKGAEELILNPTAIAANIDWGSQTVREHMMVLREYGLVEYFDEDRALYQLSERGRAWLRGEIATDDLE
ncbi:winged helix-turn-helix domain-containing protein [Halobacterium sp. BOL4-2]|uniref:winged helix-turn-helix domain-containing protein n=1 Tax=Halobacterium sp. BOL4-2 TaxID=2810537 RepID=UPI001963F64B|nr:winged helix-turn-helix domain-containing protein [Halobacterium sp. BOL4-2]QRY25539.1 winged helix-turn-helix domain-containing protein [Halobacterium sp. BOL4-2]